MKRLYIAILLVTITALIGIFEIFITNYTVNECIDNLDRIQEEITNKNEQKAVEICKETEDEFNYLKKTILNCFYNHDILDEISNTITTAKIYLECKNYEGYYLTQESIKNQFLALKDEELINIQNIL